jgi:hypothetical protein
MGKNQDPGSGIKIPDPPHWQSDSKSRDVIINWNASKTDRQKQCQQHKENNQQQGRKQKQDSRDAKSK